MTPQRKLGPVFIYTHKTTGLVAIVRPTGEVPLEVVRQKDVPKDVEHHLVDMATLPIDAFDFHAAWKLAVADGKPSVTVHHPTAQAHAHKLLNIAAREEHSRRTVNDAIGVPLTHTDEHFKAGIQSARAAIDAGTTLDHLRAAIKSIPKEP